METASIVARRAIERCDRLGKPPFSESDGGLFRRYLTPAHRAAIDEISGWMADAGMTTRLDPMATLIGRYEAAPANAPALIIGSHIDSVRNAGHYDGPLGVMLGIACVAELSRTGRRLPFAIEIVAFGDEEGSRFPQSMCCSRAMAGAYDPAHLDLKDADGISLAQALTAFGLDLTEAASAARPTGQVIAYLEPHIEQGPVLESESLALGAVSGIACQRRLSVRFTGKAGHAGTSPMHLRRDAIAGAAEAILAVEAVCAAGPPDLVGTVGRIETSTGLFNVIAGEARIGLDIRAERTATRDAAITDILARLKALAERRNLGLDVTDLQTLDESLCDPRLTALLEASIADAGAPPRRLVSGAAHDAMIMAAIAPTAMLFIRCAGGVSHHPDESVTVDDVALAHRTISAFVDRLTQDFAP